MVIMSSQSKFRTDNIKSKSIPCRFHTSGDRVEATGLGGGDLSTLGNSTDNIIRVATPGEDLKKKTIHLSLSIKFDSSEPNKFFRLSVGANSGETNLTEIKRQTLVLRGGEDDKYNCGDVHYQFWRIPLHLLTTDSRYFYLNVHFDTVPEFGFAFKDFLIDGLIEVGENYEYKEIK